MTKREDSLLLDLLPRNLNHRVGGKVESWVDAHAIKKMTLLQCNNQTLNID